MATPENLYRRAVRGGTLPHTVIFKNFFAAIETTKPS
jgi:hypothetical protein